MAAGAPLTSADTTILVQKGRRYLGQSSQNICSSRKRAVTKKQLIITIVSALVCWPTAVATPLATFGCLVLVDFFGFFGGDILQVLRAFKSAVIALEEKLNQNFDAACGTRLGADLAIPILFERNTLTIGVYSNGVFLNYSSIEFNTGSLLNLQLSNGSLVQFQPGWTLEAMNISVTVASRAVDSASQSITSASGLPYWAVIVIPFLSIFFGLALLMILLFFIISRMKH